jgi:hypothetical protein
VRIGWLWLGIAMAALTACSGGKDEEHAEEGPICSALSEMCHEAAESDPEAADCHDIGHAADEDACDAETDRCKGICEGGDTGA